MRALSLSYIHVVRRGGLRGQQYWIDGRTPPSERWGKKSSGLKIARGVYDRYCEVVIVRDMRAMRAS